MKPANDASVPEGFKGKKNIYTCDTCGGHIVTVDIDAGVTPFMIACKVAETCEGRMRSSLYRVFDQSMRASFEWYRPGAPQSLSAHTLDHVMKGGLLLRAAIDPRGAMHFNYVPPDHRFCVAAISFVIDNAGCGAGGFNGDDVDKLTFLEDFNEGALEQYPAFFDFCELKGLPVLRKEFAAP